ncbi:ABC transporter substrate-binding protein [Dehalobacterium formicoaceticum]|uniref:ABC transporter substrate-binding protein n=1 Tax=Dehalobacterium formicoaceticum TaxID=51515 RepID=A0ABT1Y423_9FIRM|nr:ABC transporter substrate-binding protein [Dehalobacterium formicoaceticum]MCR6545629.1 ABC transporter substrate-binding protein [Dehalobacterium formicoaceticum]
MRFSKKILVFFAIMLIAALGAGCGGQEPTGNEGENPANGAGEPVKVGLNFELSGDVATYGGNGVKGIEMAAKEINAKGGVLGGRQIELVKVDNKSDAAEVTNVQTRLLTVENVAATIGPATSTNSLAAIPVAMENEIPLLTPSATADKVTVDEATGKAKEYAFRLCFYDSLQGNIGANFIYNNLGLKKAAVYIDTNSDYSKAIGSVFKKDFTALGGEIIAEENYVKTDQDYKATLTRIKNAKPEVIYLPGYYNNVGLIVKQAREMGITVPFVGADGYDSPDLVKLGGAKNLNNVFFTNHYSSQDTDPKVRAFVEAFKAEYGDVPDAFAAMGYDAMYLMADAINRAGSDDPIAIKDALAATKDFPAVTGTLTMDDKHNPIKSVVILELVDGVPTFKDKIDPIQP